MNQSLESKRDTFGIPGRASRCMDTARKLKRLFSIQETSSLPGMTP